MKTDDLDRNKNVQLLLFWLKKLDTLVRWICFNTNCTATNLYFLGLEYVCMAAVKGNA